MKLYGYSTTFTKQKRNTIKNEYQFMEDQGIEDHLLNLYPNVKYQVWEGFGGAVTDSSGYVFSKMSKTEQESMISRYFDVSEMGYTIVRVPLDSCDFSRGHYEAVSAKGDLELSTFSLEHIENTIIPLLEAAKIKTKGKLKVMLSPWSPPAFTKTNGERNNGGKLKKEYYEFWAQYICRYIKEIYKRGFEVNRMTLQNEPKAVQTWDSCIFSAEEEKEFLRDYMWPALQKNKLSDIEIFIWDHNKERVYERACEIIDNETDFMIAGIAFHWYSGDHFDTLKMVKEQFPNKKLILSEACIEYSKFSKDDYLLNAQKYAHDIIGNMNNGMTAFYDWNILLDGEGGPNHVGNFCDAPFMYDYENNKLTEKNTVAYIWHFSHFIRSKAVRIGYSKYTDELEITAFQNIDRTIAVVILNKHVKEISLNVRLSERCKQGEQYAQTRQCAQAKRCTHVKIEPESITTLVVKLD